MYNVEAIAKRIAKSIGAELGELVLYSYQIEKKGPSATYAHIELLTYSTELVGYGFDLCLDDYKHSISKQAFQTASVYCDVKIGDVPLISSDFESLIVKDAVGELKCCIQNRCLEQGTFYDSAG